MATRAMRGIAASAGIANGPVFRYALPTLTVELRQMEESTQEWARLNTALEQARTEVHMLFKQARQSVGAAEAAIFEAHELFLDDPELLEMVQTSIEQKHYSADYAWQNATQSYAAQLRAIPDEYLAARAVDLEDIAQRVLRRLQGQSEHDLLLTEPVILVATDLTPSETVRLDTKNVRAFCTGVGSATSHVAILARALGIPAVTGLGKDLEQLQDGMQVLVDGAAGEVVLEPDQQVLDRYLLQAQKLAKQREIALAHALEPAQTLDGLQVELVANIGSPEQAVEALTYGAEGIGLLRTEFLFLERATPPTEEEQSALYRQVLQTMEQRPVVVRTFDIGGDKPAAYLPMPDEMNPFLGVRGVRLALQQREVFQTQLCALLRAGVGHHLKIMVPMVASIEELLAVREQVQQAQADLVARNLPYAENYELGIMIEVPAAALMADLLAEHVDFFSIGTNDLAQYTLAADRTNASLAHLSDALHPAVLRLIRMVIDAAHEHGKWVGLCGELASEPLAAPLLLGLGLDEWSMTASAIPLIKQTIRNYHSAQAHEITQHVLASCRNAAEVRAYIRAMSEAVHVQP
ncbi:phosphoenolpyruvate--protein phosphotransferase [Tengunoibacter tsumagoiensis]|uniref:Phosphoenolpyruvate-protein phosphotransferase n=1 Tax=Tengunoibacter tsumagoiensis TaxID=2014871 RepID=A0A402A321_9CHLR|nr:phosphoenolpyruvate--protein phosphotransferase [Tengunoibacter tsumagoiensis]GCE13558.1 phosphoenolpyruvate-protein phosphotransferase [Tengunoibacter tsumagoiensis]